jgi:hypothetical protein
VRSLVILIYFSFTSVRQVFMGGVSFPLVLSYLEVESMISFPSDEERLVALIVVSLRYGIDIDSIKEFVRKEVSDLETRRRCFVLALEVNDYMDTAVGKGPLAVALVVEYVREFLVKKKGEMKTHESPLVAPSLEQTATVIRLYKKVTDSEASLCRLGQQVIVVDEAPLWTFVDIPESAESGWVPRDTLSYNEQT